MMTDIVELLKMAARNGNALAGEAADEIERLRGVEQDAAEWVEERTKRLRADNERLRAALREIITAHESFWDEDIPADASDCDVRVNDAIADTWLTVAEISTRALEGKDE